MIAQHSQLAAGKSLGISRLVLRHAGYNSRSEPTICGLGKRSFFSDEIEQACRCACGRYSQRSGRAGLRVSSTFSPTLRNSGKECSDPNLWPSLVTERITTVFLPVL